MRITAHDNGTVQFTFFLVIGLYIYILFSSLNIENGLKKHNLSNYCDIFTFYNT